MLSAPSWLSSCRVEDIEQGYLAIEADEVEVRLRRRGGRTELTVKRGEGAQRIEKEVELDAPRFEALWPLTDGRRVQKSRHYVPSEPGEIEVDVYRGDLNGLITAEIEFDHEQAAAAFVPADWFGPEVTGDPRYANKSLATRGAPPDAPLGAAATSPELYWDLGRRRALISMVAPAENASGPTVIAAPRASLRVPGTELATAIEELERAPAATSEVHVIERCVSYGAAAIGAAEALFDRGRLMAQVRPSRDRILGLIGEQRLDRGWAGKRAPIAAWRETFEANHRELTEGNGPDAGLFDRLITAAGVAADLCGWLEAEKGRAATATNAQGKSG